MALRYCNTHILFTIISQFTEYRNTGAKKETFYEIKYPSVLTAAMKMNERIFNSLYLENE